MRYISTKRYIAAFVITTIVFLIGLAVGIIIEKARINKADFLNTKQFVDYSSIQLQQSYLETLGDRSCSAMDIILMENLEELDKAMRRVVTYEKDSLIEDEQLKIYLREYFLTEIRYIMLSSKVKLLCDTDSINAIYFYGYGTEEQGYVLDYMKKTFGEKLLIFSFNYEMRDEEPMIKVLANQYNVSIVPSVVLVDGKDFIKFDGFVGNDVLYKEVCERVGC